MGGSDMDGENVAVFGPLREALREHVYPVTTAELIEVYGGFEFEGPDGIDRLEDVLMRADERSFRKPRDVRDAIVTGLAAGPAFEADEALTVLDSDDGDGDWSTLSR